MKKYLILIFTMLLFGCQRDTLTDSDSGKIFQTSIGSTFKVELNENATTGYRWRFETMPESQMVIYQISDNIEGPETKRIGAGSKRVVTYQATNAGTVKLMGFHTRPWEGNQRQPSVEYTITVRP